MSNQSEANVETATQADTNIWKRALIMVFFAIVMRIVELVLGAVMLCQFVTKLATGRTISSLTEFGTSLARYVAQIVRFQTFVSEARPYPFAAWPTAGSDDVPPSAPTRMDANPTVTDAPNDSPGTSGTPNPA